MSTTLLFWAYLSKVSQFQVIGMRPQAASVARCIEQPPSSSQHAKTSKSQIARCTERTRLVVAMSFCCVRLIHSTIYVCAWYTKSSLVCVWYTQSSLVWHTKSSTPLSFRLPSFDLVTSVVFSCVVLDLATVFTPASFDHASRCSYRRILCPCSSAAGDRDRRGRCRRSLYTYSSAVDVGR